MHIDEKQFGAEVSIEDGLKRKRTPEVLCSPKRMKKHPSPSPENLKLWEDAMDELKKTDFVSYEDVSLPSNAFAKNELPKGESVPNLPTEGLNSTMRRKPTEKGAFRQSIVNRNRYVGVMDVDEEDELHCNNPNYILTRTRKP
jgi:hypothetical protein